MPYEQTNYFVAEPDTYYNDYEEERSSSETGSYPFPHADTPGACTQFPHPLYQPGYQNPSQPGCSLPIPNPLASNTPYPHAPPNPYPQQSRWPEPEPYQYQPGRQSTDRGFGEDVGRLKKKTKASFKTAVAAVQAAMHFSQGHPNQQSPPDGPVYVTGLNQWLPPPGQGINFPMPQAQQAPVLIPWFH
ncbi:hypothetical protein FRB98_008631 [Tulasnella sp. 332]|nr:hypothetical protein FRB98_008631 [Tulasnella sp. 332]